MSHAPDSAETGGALLSIGSVVASTVAPHPLQILAWVVAILAGIYAIYRGWKAEKRAEERDRRERQAFEEE